MFAINSNKYNIKALHFFNHCILLLFVASHSTPAELKNKVDLFRQLPGLTILCPGILKLILCSKEEIF
jgi:hypothetical protein